MKKQSAKKDYVGIIIGIVVAFLLGVIIWNVRSTHEITNGVTYSYNTKNVSKCISINDSATITCDCYITIGNDEHKFSNTINAASCNNSNDTCGELCSKIAEDLVNK